MTVYLSKRYKHYRYDFWYLGRRYQGNTGQITKADAKKVEELKRAQLRRLGAGIVDPRDSPSFSEWAATYVQWIRSPRNPQRLKRPEHVDQLLNVVLRFWGTRPPEHGNITPIGGEPYHDLRLVDPVEEPDWILRFEDWMHARGVGPQTRNHYRSVMSRMYRTAMIPRFRKQTGVTLNPFAGAPRDRTPARVVTITADELTRWIAHAPYHVSLAVAIGALAPKLRLANILALDFRKHLDADLEYITVWNHKTDRSGKPLVSPISRQLRKILKHRRRLDTVPWVVHHRGKPVRDIRTGIRKAASAAKLRYGRDVGGVTFHTLRHVAQTEMAALGITETQRSAAVGQTLQTAQRYTHLRPTHEIKTLEQLSKRLPIADAVMAARRVTGRGTAPKRRSERQ